MPSPEIIRAFLSQVSTSGSRSTALQPLAWLSGILTSGLVFGLSSSAPTWALIALSAFLGITVTLYLLSYIYFAIKNPDALRSERYTLSKMAIEKNLIGDNTVGLVEVEEYGNTPEKPSLPILKEDDK